MDTTAEQKRERKNTARLILAITLLLVFIMAARSPLDSDLWWHLRAGEETLRSGRPLLADVFSYTRSGSAWINHSWLAQVLLALLYRAGGFPALGTLVALTAAGSMALVYAQMRGPALLRAFLLVLASAVAAVVWTPRPQLFSLLLLAVTGWVLHHYRQSKKDRLLLWLLPLFVLWSNLHGGYPLGLLLIGATAAGEILNRLWDGSDSTALSWRQIGKLLVAGAAGFLLTALNPNGVQMWLIPFKTVNVGVLQALIQEWASPDFHDPVQQPFLVLLLGTAAAWALSRKRANGVGLVSVLVFGAMALAARRNFGPFAIVAAPVLSVALEGLAEDPPALFRSPAILRIANQLRQINAKSSAKPAHPRLKKAINLLIIALLGMTAIIKLYSVTHPAFLEAQLRRDYPVGAVAWMRANQPEGRLLNAYNWGGYLLWALPEYPVFVDGRTDLYGDDLLGQWITVIQAGEGWQSILDRWQVRLVLLEPGRPVVSLLPGAGWKLLSQEKGYVLYGR